MMSANGATIDLRSAIASALEEAMQGDDEVRLSTLRLIHCAVKDRDMAALKRDEANGCERKEITAILAQMVAQREESIKSYDESGRPDMAERERREIEVISEFLPAKMDESELKAAAADLIDELEASGLKDVGRCMSELKSRYSGRMDVTKAGAMVKALLS